MLSADHGICERLESRCTAALSFKKTLRIRRPASPRTQQLGHMGSHYYCSMKAYRVRTAMTGMLCLSRNQARSEWRKFSQCKLS